MISAKEIGYIAIVTSCLVAAFLYKVRTEGIFACPADGYDSRSFLAYCNSTGYGDYDRGAFWFDLEPSARKTATKADVLFLGSSPMQFAFSNDVTSTWFGSAAISYYLLGFNFGENSSFAGPLLSRLKPQARVYVVNLDRFFENRATRFAETFQSGNGVLELYEDRKLWQVPHRWLCGTFRRMCGTQRALFRSRDTGAWRFIPGTAKLVAEDVSDGPATNRDLWNRYAALGDAFISGLPTDRECVVLTIVPSASTRRAEAKSIADDLGMDLISPILPRLTTFDGGHLDSLSASRWAEAFFDAAGPRIRDCLSKGPSAGRRDDG